MGGGQVRIARFWLSGRGSFPLPCLSIPWAHATAHQHRVWSFARRHSSRPWSLWRPCAESGVAGVGPARELAYGGALSDVARPGVGTAARILGVAGLSGRAQGVRKRENALIGPAYPGGERTKGERPMVTRNERPRISTASSGALAVLVLAALSDELPSLPLPLLSPALQSFFL